MRYPTALRVFLILCLCSLVPIVLSQAPAFAQDTVRIAYIDPLSGGGASIGEVGVKTFQFMADEINAKGGVLGKKLEIVPYDNKLNPQESLVQVQKAIDAGIRIVTQGNGSSVAAAISDFAAKFNERNPGKEFLFLNYAAVDPVLTNEKCNYWHFRWDANSDIKMEALTNYMKTRPSIKKIYLINQDYSFGQAVRAAAKTMLAAKRPDIQIVGDEMHPLLKITDFAPYVAKIKASGADSVITGNWGQDFALLLKAAADAGLQIDWYTYYAAGTGGPTAIKQSGCQPPCLRNLRGTRQHPASSFAGLRAGIPRQIRHRTVLPARRQPDAHAGRSDQRSEVARGAEDRRQARRDESRRFRRRRWLHAKGRSPILPAHVYCLIRRTQRKRAVRRGEDRLGLAHHHAPRHRQYDAADQLQDGSSELKRACQTNFPIPSAQRRTEQDL